MDVRNMKAWKTAKLKYEELNTHTMFPLFGKQLSPEEIIERLEMILNVFTSRRRDLRQVKA